MLEKLLNNRLFTLYLAPFVLGCLSTLSFEPFNIVMINFFVFPFFFYLINFINKKSKVTYRKKPYKINLFILGQLFGFGFYISGISWISNSLTFDENFQILIPFAIILIPLFLSLFIGITILLIGPYIKLNFISVILFSASLAFSDYLRAKILSGFPWNLWAYSASSFNEILQVINYIGLYSFNLLIITFFTLPILILNKTSVIKKIIFIVFLFFSILGLYLHGNYVINKNKELVNKINNKKYVKIISPNFDLKYGLTEVEIIERFKKLIRYSEPNKNRETLFIWPEGVFSGYSYNEILNFKKLISDNFSEKHHILFGINSLNVETGGLYNSMLIVNNNLEIIQSYNKRKLVPFGEFLPFENLIESFGFKKITEGYGSFLKGNKNNNLIINKINILPLICYEVIFTDLIQKSEESTNLIVNISEDGWFGKSIGPNQHFAKSIYRAIENNTYFLRSANKGISAIIDNNGNIIRQLNRNEPGNIEFEVPLIKSNKIKNDLIFFILLFTYFSTFLIYYKKNAK